MAVLELGTQAVDLFPGVQNDLLVIWRTNNTEKGDTRFLTKTGTVTQVKFWLTGYLNHGFFQELNGWTDITGQIEAAAERRQSLDEGSEKQNDWRSLLFELSPAVRTFWAEQYNNYINPNGNRQSASLTRESCVPALCFLYRGSRTMFPIKNS